MSNCRFVTQHYNATRRQTKKIFNAVFTLQKKIQEKIKKEGKKLLKKMEIMKRKNLLKI